MASSTGISFSDIIALLALLLSLFTLHQQNKKDKIIQNTVFFEKVFFDFLVRDCVEARNYIKFNSQTGKIENTDRLEEKIAELGSKISFYEYIDKDFYAEVKNKLNSIDELLLSDESHNGRSQTVHSNKIDRLIEELFKIITSKYFIK